MPTGRSSEKAPRATAEGLPSTIRKRIQSQQPEQDAAARLSFPAGRFFTSSARNLSRTLACAVALRQSETEIGYSSLQSNRRNSLAPLLDLLGALGAIPVPHDLFQALYKVRPILVGPRLLNDVRRFFEPAAKHILDD